MAVTLDPVKVAARLTDIELELRTERALADALRDYADDHERSAVHLERERAAILEAVESAAS